MRFESDTTKHCYIKEYALKSFLGPNRIFDIIILFTLFIFSFFFTFKTGERGFFAFDQSIVFDGGYRIISGQVPYKDFVIPIGPVVFWIQAIFFKILGISYFSYIFAAASVNVMSTACSIAIIRLLFPGTKFLSYISGLLTAIWFYPPFGVPLAEQTAFFFSFLSIAALLSTQLFNKDHPIIKKSLLLLSGCFALLSLLSKQNAGLYILPLYFILLIAIHLPALKLIFYTCIVFCVGFVGSLALFLLWLCIKSDFRIFMQYFFQIPSLLGFYRALEERANLWEILFRGTCRYSPLHILPAGIRLFLFSAFLISIFTSLVYVYNYKKFRDSWRKEFLSCLLCVYAISFQYVFIHTTMNQGENGIPFIGIIFAISMALLLHLYNARLFKIKPLYPKFRFINQYVIKLILAIAISLPLVYASVLGIKVSLTRKIHEFNNSEFQRYFAIDKLKALKWAQPTRVGEADIKEQDIINLFDYLKTKNNNFFIFPNFTLFYGLLSVPSPQPILWFHKGLTYHVLYNPDLDKWVVDDLKKNAVKIIVIEDEPSYNHYILNDFPQLKSFISENFIKAKQLGIFNIYEKTNPRIL